MIVTEYTCAECGSALESVDRLEWEANMAAETHAIVRRLRALASEKARAADHSQCAAHLRCATCSPAWFLACLRITTATAPRADA